MSSSSLLVFYFVFAKREGWSNSFIMKRDKIKTRLEENSIKTFEDLLNEDKIKSQLKPEEIQKLTKECKNNEKQKKWFENSTNNYYKPKVVYYCSENEIEDMLKEAKKSMQEKYRYFYAQLLMFIAFSYPCQETIENEFKDFFSDNIYLLSVNDALSQNTNYSHYLLSLLNSNIDFFQNNEKDEVNTSICGRYFSTILKLPYDNNINILQSIEKLLNNDKETKEKKEKLLRDIKDQLIHYCIVNNKCNSSFLKIPKGMFTCSLDLSKFPDDIIGNKDEITYLNFVGKINNVTKLSNLTRIPFKDILKMAFTSSSDKIAVTYISIFQNIQLKNCIFIYNDADKKKEKISKYYQSSNYSEIDINEIGFEDMIAKKNMCKSTVENKYYCIKKDSQLKLTNLIPNWYFIDIESTPYELFKIFSIKLNSKKDCIISIEFNFEDNTSCDFLTLINLINQNKKGEPLNEEAIKHLLNLKNCIKYFINSNLKNILEEDNYTLPPNGETFRQELRRIIQTFYWIGLLNQKIPEDVILKDLKDNKIPLLSDEEKKDENYLNKLIISVLVSGKEASSLPSFIDYIQISKENMITILQTSLSLTKNYQKLVQEAISIYYNSKDKEHKPNREIITFLYNMIKSQKNKYFLFFSKIMEYSQSLGNFQQVNDIKEDIQKITEKNILLIIFSSLIQKYNYESLEQKNFMIFCYLSSLSSYINNSLGLKNTKVLELEEVHNLICSYMKNRIPFSKSMLSEQVHPERINNDTEFLQNYFIIQYKKNPSIKTIIELMTQNHKDTIFKSKDLMCVIKSLTPQQLSFTSLKESLTNDNIEDKKIQYLLLNLIEDSIFQILNEVGEEELISDIYIKNIKDSIIYLNKNQPVSCETLYHISFLKVYLYYFYKTVNNKNNSIDFSEVTIAMSGQDAINKTLLLFLLKIVRKHCKSYNQFKNYNFLNNQMYWAVDKMTLNEKFNSKFEYLFLSKYKEDNNEQYAKTQNDVKQWMNSLKKELFRVNTYNEVISNLLVTKNFDIFIDYIFNYILSELDSEYYLNKSIDFYEFTSWFTVILSKLIKTEGVTKNKKIFEFLLCIMKNIHKIIEFGKNNLKKIEFILISIKMTIGVLFRELKVEPYKEQNVLSDMLYKFIELSIELKQKIPIEKIEQLSIEKEQNELYQLYKSIVKTLHKNSIRNEKIFMNVLYVNIKEGINGESTNLYKIITETIQDYIKNQKDYIQYMNNQMSIDSIEVSESRLLVLDQRITDEINNKYPYFEFFYYSKYPSLTHFIKEFNSNENNKQNYPLISLLIIDKKDCITQVEFKNILEIDNNLFQMDLEFIKEVFPGGKIPIQYNKNFLTELIIKNSIRNVYSENGIIQSNGDIIEYNYNAIEKALSNLIYDSMINK